MRCSTRIALALLAAVSISSGGLAATPPAHDDTPDQVRIGTGVICDTQDEVAHFVRLMGEHDPRGALIAVNRQVANPAACGMATVAFRTGKKIGEVRTSKGAFSIMEIEILAGTVDGNWQMMTPTRTQYTAVAVEGYDV
jgi:hypothetical protein